MKNSKLKEAIFLSGNTQRKVARKAGIPEAHLSMAIHGKFNLDSVQKAKVASVLGRPQQDLFTD